MVSENIKKIRNRNFILIAISIIFLIFLVIGFILINDDDNNNKYWKIIIILILFSIFISILISEFIIYIWINFYYNDKIKTDFTSNFMGIFVIILPLIIFGYYFNY